MGYLEGEIVALLELGEYRPVEVALVDVELAAVVEGARLATLFAARPGPFVAPDRIQDQEVSPGPQGAFEGLEEFLQLGVGQVAEEEADEGAVVAVFGEGMFEDVGPDEFAAGFDADFARPLAALGQHTGRLIDEGDRRATGRVRGEPEGGAAGDVEDVTPAVFAHQIEENPRFGAVRVRGGDGGRAAAQIVDLVVLRSAGFVVGEHAFS